MRMRFLWVLAMSLSILAVRAHTETNLLSSPAEVRAILADHSGLCVYRNDTNLTVLKLPELTTYTLGSEKKGIYNIKISPDGKYVLYETASTTSGQPNRMILRSLAQGSSERFDIGPGFYPHWWVDPLSKELSIVWASLDHVASVTSYDGETYRQKIVNNQLSGTREILLNQAYKAGLSADGNWLGTAYQTPFLYDLKNQKEHKLTTYKASTCWPRMNPTANPSHMDEICYINNNHDTLITKNSKDQIVWQMPFPSEFGTWSTTNKWHSNGWSNHENYMLTAVINGGKYKRILLDRSTKQYAKVFENSSAHQDMWIAGVAAYDPANTAINRSMFRPVPYAPSRDMAFVSIMGSRPTGKSFQGFQRAVLYNAQGAVVQEVDFSRSDSIYSLDRMIQENRKQGPLFIRMFK